MFEIKKNKEYYNYILQTKILCGNFDTYLHRHLIEGFHYWLALGTKDTHQYKNKIISVMYLYYLKIWIYIYINVGMNM